MENNVGVQEGNIKAEDVISKLKDDGDFDRLRVKIIRKLKENEELRNNIISMVKQSAALNHPGAENMKPRQLSDAIHQEIGDQVMGQISNGVWNIIRSDDGMKPEITDTVQSVYNRLSNPEGNDDCETSSRTDLLPGGERLENNVHVTVSSNEINGIPSIGEPNESPGFASGNRDQSKNNNTEKPNERLGMPMLHKGETVELKEGNFPSADDMSPDNLDIGPPPGFSSILEHKQSGNPSDEDPDVPPGFG